MLQKAYFPVIPLPEVDAPEVAPELALASSPPPGT